MPEGSGTIVCKRMKLIRLSPHHCYPHRERITIRCFATSIATLIATSIATLMTVFIATSFVYLGFLWLLLLVA